MISDCFEDLAQSLRVLLERRLGFNELFVVDADEAIGNLELAHKSVLDSFHSLADAARAEKGLGYDFYSSALAKFVLTYRNAKHHNHANSIRSIYKIARTTERKDILLVDFPANRDEVGGSFMDYYVCWGDFLTLYQMPRSVSRINAQAPGQIREAIGADIFEAFARQNNYSSDAIFLNVVPIIIGACNEITPYIAPRINTGSTESEAFLWQFQNIGTAEFSQPEYAELSSSIYS